MRASLLLLPLLAACAGFELPAFGLSESQCYGVKVDEPAYMAAWREAYSDWSMRTNPGAGGD